LRTPFRFENNSKKNENNEKKLEVFCNFWILSNLIQKREKPTRIENKNEKNNRTTKKRKQIENISKKKKIEFFCNNFWILPNLTQFDHFSSSQKGPQKLWRLGDRDLFVKNSMMIHMNTQKQLSKQPKTLR